MEIRTVEMSGDGHSFVVNKNVDADDDRQLSVPDDMGNCHRVMIQEWIDAGGVVSPWANPITPLMKWHDDMAKADKTMMPRYAEDILDGMADKSGVNQISLDRLQTKKDLRATKP
jgi:hypothetical protein